MCAAQGVIITHDSRIKKSKLALAEDIALETSQEHNGLMDSASPIAKTELGYMVWL